MNYKERFRELIDELKKRYTQIDISKRLRISSTTLSKCLNFETYYPEGKGKFIFEKRFKQSLKEFDADLKEKNGQWVLKEETPLPQEEIFPNLNNHVLVTDALKEKKNKELLIIDTWMPYIINQGMKMWESWIDSCEKIKVLVLDPRSDLIKKRIKSLVKSSTRNTNPDYDNYYDSLLQSLEILINSADHQDNDCIIEIKLYDQLPGLNAFILDSSIFYCSFLSFSFSGNAFIHRVNNGDGNYVEKNINNHFYELWESERSYYVSREEFLAIRFTIKNAPKHTSRVLETLSETLANSFVLYNLDENKDSTPFQISELYVENWNFRRCKLTYQDRERLVEVDRFGKFEATSNGNLIFRFHEDDFFLEFLILIANVNFEQVDFLQIVYLHTNTANVPMSNIGLLYLKDRMTQDVSISRSTEDVRYPIRKFLSNKDRKPLMLDPNLKVLKNQQSEDEVYLESLCNKDWVVYFPERFSNDEYNNDHLYINKIGKARLRFLLDDISKTFKATFETREKYKLNAVPEIEHLHNKDILVLDFKTDEISKKPFRLQIFIYLDRKEGRSDRYEGTFQIAYPLQETIGCGFLIVQKSNDQQSGEKLSFTSLDLLKLEKLHSVSNISHLFFKEKSSLLLKPGQNKSINFLECAGIYKIYSYGRKSKDDKSAKKELQDRCIIIGKIIIHPTGFVQLESTFKGRKASGRIEYLLGNYFIQLTNEDYLKSKTINDKLGRRGFFILHTEESIPDKEEHKYLCGIFSGLSNNNSPLAKRVILERITKDFTDDSVHIKPDKLRLFSLEYEKLNNTIQKILTGRIPNYIGFQRLGRALLKKSDLEEYQGKRIDIGFLFISAAIVKANNIYEEDSIEPINQLLIRGFQHGYLNIEFFKTQITSSLQYKNIMNLSVIKKFRKFGKK